MEKFNALASQYHSLQKDLSIVLESAIVQPIKAEGNTDHSKFYRLLNKLSNVVPTVLLRTKLAPEVEKGCEGEELSAGQVKEDMRRLEKIIQVFAEAKEDFESELKESTKTVYKGEAEKANVLLESTIKLMFNGSL